MDALEIIVSGILWVVGIAIVLLGFYAWYKLKSIKNLGGETEREEKKYRHWEED